MMGQEGIGDLGLILGLKLPRGLANIKPRAVQASWGHTGAPYSCLHMIDSINPCDGEHNRDNR